MVHKRDYEKDVVYHYCFPRADTVPNVSPFSLKLETFMRLHNIRYENVYTLTKRSKHGLLPFVELNGQTIADSQLIIEKLKTVHNIKEFENPEEAAVHRAFQRMIENHTFFVLNKFKILDRIDEMGKAFLKNTDLPKYLKPLAKPILKWKLVSRAKSRQNAALGNYSDEDFKMLLKKDLDAFRDFLGEKKYFAGNKITLTDCSLFGILASAYYLKIENYFKQLIKVDYPTIVAFLENVKQELWKDDFEKKPEVVAEAEAEVAEAAAAPKEE
ncbi:unnamed protein product [Auanema sp. JU1783]|nr:unnamed protein product [Auanema sp. JU1783]